MLQLLKGSYNADDLYFLQRLLENGLDSVCSMYTTGLKFPCSVCARRNVCMSAQRLANYAGQIADSMVKEKSE